MQDRGMISLPTPEYIEKMAHEAGLTMRQVCLRAGVHQANFSRWKSGSKIQLDTVGKLIAAIESEENK
jgi:predicted transcriptional regulator